MRTSDQSPIEARHIHVVNVARERLNQEVTTVRIGIELNQFPVLRPFTFQWNQHEVSRQARKSIESQYSSAVLKAAYQQSPI